MNGPFKSKLPRLPREYYQGRAMVLWTHTLENRATGWLDERFHARFREVLLHAMARYEVATPCYVLMPDHWHLVWMGLSEASDQSLASRFLRKHLGPELRVAKLQDRPHDHVLRETERERGAFQSTCAYVLHNPERAGLCADWREWLFLGAMVVGYPVLDPRTDIFWPDFWKLYNLLGETTSVAVARRGVARRGSGGTVSTPGHDPALPDRATSEPPIQ